MWKIPLGRFFETVIDWSKENLAFVFDLIDTVLDFVIGLLSQFLLLNHEAIYPSVFFALAAGFIAYFLISPKSRGIRLAVGIAVIIGVSLLEIWRYSTLEAEMAPAEIAGLKSEITEYREALEAAAPSDYRLLLELVAEAETVAPDENRFIRNLGRIERRTNRLDPGRFGDAAELAADVAEVFDDERIDAVMPDELREKVDSTIRYYSAFSGIRESERLVQQLDRLDEPQNRHSLLNRRTFERTLVYLDASIENAENIGIPPETVADWRALRSHVASLDPDRLEMYPAIVWIVLFSLLAFLIAGAGLMIFSALGFFLILSMDYWIATMETLALVMASTFFALLIGIPVGIGAARSNTTNQAIRPVLDFMQTMPAFVYLIPAVLFFGLGHVPGAIATLIFAMPPAVRLTALGIRQVPQEVVEAGQAFGATPGQLLYKAQLPIAMPTILAGLNQTIMLALSMVVIGGMIGAGGLGEQVLTGITQMNIAVGFESGIAVVILAIYLDRITQRLGGQSHHKSSP